ncbi:MAG: hypothetical protein H6R18_2009 [Proteobacteria bacterium]|nr:hypothetical protein [Pseudomonadota bacterium]
MDNNFISEEQFDVRLPSLGALLAVIAFGALCLTMHVLQGWVPVLDSANLALHEAGHPIIGLFSGRLMFYGGTLFQLAFPLAAAWHFRRSDHAAGFAATLVWLGENLLNVARYMADARAQVLPLVGGDHDWAEIFGRWGVLHLDTGIAWLIRSLGIFLVVGSCFWLFRRLKLAK